MLTMNPIDMYHDPDLDGLVYNPDKPRRDALERRISAGESRRPGNEQFSAKANGRPPSVSSTASTGAPITYRGVGPDVDPSLHRSFSQRAKDKSLPYADEAFDDDEFEDTDIAPPRQNSKPDSSRNRQQHVSKQNREENHVNGIEGSTQRMEKLPAASQGQQASTRALASQPVQAPAPPRTPEPVASYHRSTTLRDASNQTEEQQRDWASDRSPLQKLEVKLTDISKEEKRARVQEAEMRLMKNKNIPQTPERARRHHSDRVQSNTHPAHNLSNRVIEDRAVSTRSNPSSGRPGGRAQAGANTSQSRAVPSEDRENREGRSVRSKRLKDDDLHYAAAPSKSQPASQQASREYDSRTRDPVRSTSARQATDGRTFIDASQPRTARAVSLQQPRSRPREDETEKPISQQERSASRQAALERLTAQGSPDDSRSGPRKLQKSPSQNKKKISNARSIARADSPPAVDLSSMAGGDPGLDPSQSRKLNGAPGRQLPAQYDQQPQSYSSRDQQNFGLGLQQSPALRSVDSPPVSSIDVSKQRQRKSSVSFKEPFDRRRPVEEWKEAGTARLTLADFSFEKSEPVEQKAWWEQDKTKNKRSSRARTASDSQAEETIDDRTAQFKPRLYIKCGPLLRYAGLKRTKDGARSGIPSTEFWRGSVMIVTQDSQCSYESTPTLRLFSQPRKLLPPPPAQVTPEELTPEYIDPIAGLTKLSRTGRARYVRPIDHLEEEKDLSLVEDDNGIYEESPSPLDGGNSKDPTVAVNNRRISDTDGESLGRFKEVKGVRIYADPDRDVTFWRFNIEIELGTEQQHIAYRINKGASVGFWVPAKGQSMNMMFHTCNGFSMSVDPNGFSGPDPLWRDVLNNHQTRPFHVMIGGGDQIYNDRVMVDTQHFGEWTNIRNPHHKHQVPFSTEMKEELESFYLERYCLWFSQGLFAMANASIPMVNIWDDHDIIDGFGSYPHDFMKTPVFSGLGNVAYKYYLLFQHQSIEAMTDKDESSWILGHEPGPYIQSRSRSLYLELGQSIAFLGIDCRTERTKNNVLSIDTLEIILDRCRREMVEGRTKHLIVLLGVPIAYPRLVWLENVLTSRAMDPIKALGRAGILKTKMLNKFDGGVEILDDLDDHWTASSHKDERNILIQELQDLAAEKSARVTILGGDVHLAAIGQFYSNPKLRIPKDRDHRYMPNVISSAIVNTPPPEFMADVMNKRNKVHHLDKYTDENMIPMFTHDVDGKKRNNNHLLPRRNWCSIREYNPGETPPPTPPSSVSDASSLQQEHGEEMPTDQPQRRPSFGKSDFNPRNLMRRLSSRGQVPPSSYKTGQNSDRPPQARAASFDGTSFPRDQRSSRESSVQGRAASTDGGADPQRFRPTFHRRPTNLSEKAAKKGNVLAIDAEGNEFDVNDHVNLEGGLDISINCEVNQKDPSGITTPYRLLIPALWYDGSSDREKIEEPAKVGRSNTVLQKLGLGPRRTQSAADRQGAGNWGQDMSETDSYDGNEQKPKEKPKRSFSLFGSRRNKKENYNDQTYYDENSAPPHPPIERDVSRPQFTTNPASTEPTYHINKAEDYDGSQMYDDQMYDEPKRSASMVPNSKSQSRSVSEPQAQQQYQSEENNISARPSLASERKRRPLSYTIGGSAPINPQPTAAQQPFDADAAYLEAQRQQEARYSQIMQSSQQPHSYQPPEPVMPQRQPSKQERILGIGSAADTGFNHPNQTQLRGRGIIGRNISPSGVPSNHNSSHRSQSHDHQHQHHHDNNNHHHSQHGQNNHHSHQQQPQFQPQTHYDSNPSTNRGYSGIEAYKEPKSKRKWSLSIRDRARGFLDSVEGRRKKDDLYSDEEDGGNWESDDRNREENYLEQPSTHRGHGSHQQHLHQPGEDQLQQDNFLGGRSASTRRY